MRSISLRTKAQALVSHWSALQPMHLDLDDYNREYLKRYLDDLPYNAYLAQHLVDSAALTREPEVVIDLGGGIGFNSAYLRRRFPAADVHYLDVDPASTETAKSIHRALGINDIYYTSGTLDQLGDKVGPTTFICSRDVLEHIYDLRAFFALSAPAMCNAHNTAAIYGSVFRHKEFAAIHHRAEHLGMDTAVKKDRDHHQPYFLLRRKYIKMRFPALEPAELDRLSNATRGLAVADIQRVASGQPYPPDLLACLYDNTCDPYTGNWAERCLRPGDYRRFAGDIPLRLTYPGYHTLGRKGMKVLALRLLNLIALLPIHRIQPSFTLVYSNS